MNRSIPSLVAACAALIALPACESESITLTNVSDVQFVRGGEWSDAVNLGSPINTSGREIMPALSTDGGSIYFVSDRDGGFGGNDIWVSHRTREGEWGVPMNLGALINTAAEENNPTLSVDGRLLFFDSNRSGGFGRLDIYVARRDGPEDDLGWSAPVNLGSQINTDLADRGPDYVEAAPGAPAMLYFGRGVGLQRSELYAAVLTHDGEALGPAEPVAELNSTGAVTDAPSLSADAREIFFWSNRDGGAEIWTSMRQSPTHAWATPVRVGGSVNTTFAEERPELSRDGGVLLFDSNRSGLGGQDIWLSSRKPGKK